MTREQMTNTLIARDIIGIKEGLTPTSYGLSPFVDFEFLHAILSGKGWVPYNQLTDNQIKQEFDEYDIEQDFNSNAIKNLTNLLNNEGSTL